MKKIIKKTETTKTKAEFSSDAKILAREGLPELPMRRRHIPRG